jgi:cbb3-type cytochrome oxidase maturation protein
MGAEMTGMVLLIPISLGLALTGLCAFLWTFRSGQYDDPKGDAARILYDHLDEGPPVDL